MPEPYAGFSGLQLISTFGKNVNISDRAFELARNASSTGNYVDIKAILETEYPSESYDQIQDIYLLAAHMLDTAYDVGDKIRLGEISEENTFNNLKTKFPGFSDATYKSVISYGYFISR